MLDVPHESEKRYQLIKRLKQTYVHHNHLGKNSTIEYFKNYRNLWQITWCTVEVFRGIMCVIKQLCQVYIKES